MSAAEFLCYLVMILADLAILGGTVYLIGWHGWSAWWMLLAVLLVGSTGFRRKKEKES